MACPCLNNQPTYQSTPVESFSTNTNCSTTVDTLNYLLTLVDNTLRTSGVTYDDFNQLQIYRGQVISGINLHNYCYVDYDNVAVHINNVISRYINN